MMDQQNLEREFLLELLNQVIEEKAEKKAEEQKSNDAPYSKQFSKWWSDYGNSIALLVTVMTAIIGGLWAVYTFRDQKQQELRLQRQSTIAQFVTDLSDEKKRSTAAYALAILSNEDEVLSSKYVAPFLTSQLREIALSGQDQPYKDALTQVLTTLGTVGLESVLQLNRQSAVSLKPYRLPGNYRESAVISATQPIILHNIKHNVKDLLARNTDLSSILLINADLRNMNLSKLHLNSILLIDSTLFHSDLRYTNLAGAELVGVNADCSNLYAAKLDNADLFGATLQRSNLDETTAISTTFPDDLFQVSMKGITLQHNSFHGKELSSANLQNAHISDVDFSLQHCTLLRLKHDLGKCLLHWNRS